MRLDFINGTAYFGNALETLKQIESDSVDSVITSPPYYQLRDYGFNEQWGLESDYKDYLDKMISLMGELKRVLKPTGTMWVNLGDTYAGNKEGNTDLKINNLSNLSRIKKQVKGIPNKSLMLIPHRFAIRCIDELGLILRNDIIWAKPNGMPESTTDRFSKKHEFIFFFVKNQKYYFNLDDIRDKLIHTNVFNVKFGGNKGDGNAKGIYSGNTYNSNNIKGNMTKDGVTRTTAGLSLKSAQEKVNPLGKNPGDVSDFWEITTKPNSKNHYATYNSELIRKPLIAGSPVGGVILDPFGGTGTTCFLATQFERRFIYIDANKEYFNNFVKEMSYRESQYKLNFEDMI